MGYFSKIFKLENALAKKSVEERYAKRLELEKPILDELFAWAEKLYVTPKSKLGEAVTYLRNQRRYLYNYLLDGRLEASNNRAERSVKPFVISRKNFLFANTAGGAEGSSIIFSLIETAKENKCILSTQIPQKERINSLFSAREFPYLKLELYC